MTVHLLVVDDEPDFQDIVHQKFRPQIRAQEMDFIFAANGEQALEKLRDQPDIDILLLDLNMPVMDGLTLLSELQAPQYSHLRCVVVSAYGDMQNIRIAMNRGAFDFLIKPVDFQDLETTIQKTLIAVQQSKQSLRLQQEKLELEVRNQFIRAIFGRYVSDEVVEILLESPAALTLGGEKREVTVMMSDLRGFTALSERLTPEQVVALLNRYFEVMVDIILPYGGMINEFIGDSMLVIFGAPIWREDDALRAVTCAVAMQLAMPAVNEKNRNDGLPEIEMGIGLSTGEVVAGNIGSLKRTKYGIVGRHVNLASRIESFTIGNQILVSETTIEKVGPAVNVSQQITMEAKGFENPITLYEVKGLAGNSNLSLPERNDDLVALARPVLAQCTILEGKHARGASFTASFVKLSVQGGEAHCTDAVPFLASVKLRFNDSAGKEISTDVYGKVIFSSAAAKTAFRIHFTSIPPAALEFLRSF